MVGYAPVRVHHLNCATMRPPGRRLINGTGGWLEAGEMVCHVLLVETGRELVLVDSGFGVADIRDPDRRIGREMIGITRPRLDEAETALRQVERLGFAPEDVRHIVCTHLDLDHAGGLADFPWAAVHVHAREHDAAMRPRTALEKRRYRRAQLAHGPRWVLHQERGERWHGFDCVRELDGLPPEILLLPLHGHSRGHAGVAVDTGAGWLLHAGDAYFHHGEVGAPRRSCPAGLDLFQRIVQVDGRTRVHNQDRLRELHRERGGRGGDRVAVFSAHDPVELSGML
jgi:glyoxylase-like metal-dependent hydrolase (beta-lactamase superfamily II)